MSGKLGSSAVFRSWGALRPHGDDAPAQRLSPGELVCLRLLPAPHQEAMSLIALAQIVGIEGIEGIDALEKALTGLQGKGLCARVGACGWRRT